MLDAKYPPKGRNGLREKESRNEARITKKMRCKRSPTVLSLAPANRSEASVRDTVVVGCTVAEEEATASLAFVVGNDLSLQDLINGLPKQNVVQVVVPTFRTTNPTSVERVEGTVREKTVAGLDVSNPFQIHGCVSRIVPRPHQ